MEIESWVSAKENIQYQINQPNNNYTPIPLEKLFNKDLANNNSNPANNNTKDTKDTTNTTAGADPSQ